MSGETPGSREPTTTFGFGIDLLEAVVSSILQTAPLGVLAYEESGQCILANDEAARIVGAPKEMVLAQNFREISSWQESGLLDAALGVLEFGGVARRELHTFSSFGTEVWLDCQLLRFSAAGHAFLLLLYADIRDKRLAEAQLRENAERDLHRSEERYRSLAENAQDLIWRTDTRGTVLYSNQVSQQMLGIDPEQAVGMNIAEYMAEDSIELVKASYRNAIDSTPPASAFKADVNYLHPRGHTIPCEVHVVILRDLEGKPAELQGITRDITERRKAEDKLKSTVLELERSNRELEQFAYVASHDLQEPLRNIGSYVQLLARKYSGQLDEKADKYIDFAVTGARRMQQLIDALLEVSRAGRDEETYRMVRMDETLQKAKSDLRSSIEECGATITSTELPRVFGEPMQLLRVMRNLLSNALKFRADQAPEIHVGCVALDGQWQFTISDNGIGIDPKFHERVFTIFQRLHTDTEYAGTGIGLAVCKKVIERHGGTIWVKSSPGAGASFFFTLPALGSQKSSSR